MFDFGSLLQQVFSEISGLFLAEILSLFSGLFSGLLG